MVINIKIKTILMIFVLGLSLCCRFAMASVVIDKVVAKVNSEVITKGELDRKIAQIKRYKNRDVKANKLRQQALNELIDISLQVQLAKNNGLKISDSELERVVANIAKDNGLTVNQLKKMIPEREGISFKEFRRELRTSGLIARVQQQALGKDIMPSDKDIEEVLRGTVQKDDVEYHVADILFEVPDDFSKDKMKIVKDKAKEMALKLKQGAAIVDMVKKIQQDIDKLVIVQHNDLGWRKIGGFPNIFASKVSKMKQGQVIGPVEAPNGLHVLKLLEISKSATKPMELTKAKAAEIAYQRKLMKRLKPWLKKLRENAYIKKL